MLDKSVHVNCQKPITDQKTECEAQTELVWPDRRQIFAPLVSLSLFRLDVTADIERKRHVKICERCQADQLTHRERACLMMVMTL